MGELWARRCGRFLDVYLAAMFGLTCWNGVRGVRRTAAWSLGDWFVNYGGGFVRRGLVGELVLGVARAAGVSPVTVTLLLGMAVYAVIFLVVRWLLRGSSGSWWVVAMAVSPCTLAFPAVDAFAGYHKEILYFAGLGILIWMLRRGERREWVLMGYLSVVGVFTVLSHEPEACYSVYYLSALMIGLGSLGRAVRVAVVPAILMAGALLAAVMHPGDARTVEGISRALGPGGLCDGWIRHYIGMSQEGARMEVVRLVEMGHYRLRYLVLAGLAMAPAAAGFWVLWRRTELRSGLRVVGVVAGVSMVASVPLFLYGIDWGRWIYMHVFSLFLLLMFLDVSAGRAVAAGGGVGRRRSRWAVVVCLVMYATCWNMPYAGGKDDGFAGRLLHAVQGRVAKQGGHFPV
jgi:hypothetical protein